MCVKSMRERLGTNPVPIQWPLGEEDQHRGIVDLIKMKAAVFDDASKGQKFEWVEIPADLKKIASEWHDKLIESCADVDDEIMALYLEGKSDKVTDLMLHRALRFGTINFKLVPVICGSAFKNKGVQMLLDAVVNYLPSPMDIPPVKGIDPGKKDKPVAERKASDDAPFSALAFKIINDPHGNLTFFRVYSGKVQSGTMVLNSSREKRERIGRILRMHANKREEVQEADAGNIFAAVGFRDTRTGDTLCEEKHPILLEQMIFPEPVISIAIEPKTKVDVEKLGVGLQKLAQEDPSFRVHTDDESGQTIISGMGELHLEIIVDRLKREFKVESNVGKPEVAYREAITKKAPCEYKYAKQSGGRGQYGHVVMEIEPQERGKGFTFENDIVGGVIPKEFIPAIEKGVREAMARGVVAGFPLVDMLARLTDGSYHEVDSSAQAFEVAASLCFQEGVKRAGAVILEPLMKIEVVVPEQYMGDVIGDLNSRRGRILGMSQRGNAQVIDAEIPLAGMFGYVTDLRSMTQGRGTSSMQFSHYAPVSPAIQDEIVARVKGS
jgi:elongation factor G